MNNAVISYWYAFPYYVFFLILFFLALWQQGIFKTKSKKVSLNMLVAFLFIIFFGLRGYIYSDWQSYLILFNKIPIVSDFLLIDNVRDVFDYEYGFLLFTSIVKTFTDNYQIFIFLNTLIDVVLLNLIFRDTLRFPVWGFVCFFAFGGIALEINTLRNIKSMLLFMLSIKYIVDKKFITYCFVNYIGFLFHSSALLFFPLYFVLNIQLKKKTLLVIFLASSFIYLSQVQISRHMILLLEPFLTGRLSMMTQFYLNTSTSYGLSVAFLERFLTFAIILRFYNQLIAVNKFGIVYVNLFVIYYLIYTFCSDLDIMISRVACLFSISYWILFPYIFSTIKRKKIYMYLLVYFVFVSSYKIILNNNNIMAYYDNLLWGIQSVNTRQIVINKYSDMLYNL